MTPMENWKDYLWLVKTDKGDFFFTVLGDWTREEAEKKVREAAKGIGLEINEFIPRKRATGDMTMCATIYQELEPKASPLGFELMAGKGLWEACGRGAEYADQLARLKEEMAAENPKGV
jgi:hypothetical protein